MRVTTWIKREDAHMKEMFQNYISNFIRNLKTDSSVVHGMPIHNDPEGYQTVLVNPIISAGKYPDKGIADKIADTGNNTGNLLFAEGIKEQISYKKEIWILGEGVDEVRKPAAIMPSANFIIHGSDNFIKNCTEFLLNNDCPITLAGLGAQSTPELNTPSKLVSMLTPAKKRYFKMVAERAVTLGIRGEFTAECLELMGIHNYRIIGCPSFYKHLNGKYPRLPKPSLKKTQLTVTTGTEYESRLLEMGIRLHSIWLMQMLTEMPKSAFENETISPVWVERRFPGLQVSLEEYSYYLKNYTRIFFNLDEWNHYYQEEKITFSYGSRFHGNMASIRNGVPALWIVHDSRTTELAQTLHVPYITIQKFVNIKYPEELLEFCDYKDMYSHYNELCRNYITFLEENHISHHFYIKGRI